MPARNGEVNEAQSPFGWAEVTSERLRVHPSWETGDRNFDYGAIILPEPIAGLDAVNDKLNYAHFRSEDLEQSTPTLSGYPNDKPQGTQWFETDRIDHVTQHHVFYTLNTEGGQSGSPVFFRDGDENIACAIHYWGDTSFNSGVRINADVLEQLNAWKVD